MANEKNDNDTSSGNSTKSQDKEKAKQVDLSGYLKKDEVTELLDKIRKQERDKQQSKLDEQQTKLQSYEDQLKQLQDALSNKLDAPPSPKDEDPDPLKNPGEAVLRLQKKQEEMQEQLLAQIQARQEAFQKELKQQAKKAMEESAAVKKQWEQKLLSEEHSRLTDGLMFPELVKGNTIEELRESAASAKKIEEERLGKVKEVAGDAVRRQLSQHLPKALRPGGAPGEQSAPSRSYKDRAARLGQLRKDKVDRKTFLDQQRQKAQQTLLSK